MPVKISFCNQKGGVGKTTTCVNVAASFAKRGKKSLILDCDFQANASGDLGIKFKALKEGRTLTRGLFDGLPHDDLIWPTKFKNLDIIPADQDLNEVNTRWSGQPSAPKKILEWLDKRPDLFDRYDYIFMDTRPEKSLLFQNPLVASDYYIVPTFCEASSFEGFPILFEQIREITKYLNPDLRMLGSVVTRYHKDLKGAVHYLGYIKDNLEGHDIPFLGTIRANDGTIGDASRAETPVVYFRPKLGIAQDFVKLTKSIEKAIIEAVNNPSREVETPQYTREEVSQFHDMIAQEFSSEI